MTRQTLDVLSASIPNGLHDAELKTLAIDYVKREVRLSLNISVGDLDAVAEAEREAYRHAEVILSGLIYYVCEPPDAGYPYDRGGSVRIDIGAMQTLTQPASMTLPPVPTTAFVNWIFVNEWNAFIYVAAQDARLRWLS